MPICHVDFLTVIPVIIATIVGVLIPLITAVILGLIRRSLLHLIPVIVHLVVVQRISVAEIELGTCLGVVVIVIPVAIRVKDQNVAPIKRGR